MKEIAIEMLKKVSDEHTYTHVRLPPKDGQTGQIPIKSALKVKTLRHGDSLACKIGVSKVTLSFHLQMTFF